MQAIQKNRRWRPRLERPGNLWTLCARSDCGDDHSLCARNLWPKKSCAIWHRTLDSCCHRAHRPDRRALNRGTSSWTLGRSKHRDILAALFIYGSSIFASKQTSIVDMCACQPLRDAAAVSAIILAESKRASRFVCHRLASQMDSYCNRCHCIGLRDDAENGSSMDQHHRHRVDCFERRLDGVRQSVGLSRGSRAALHDCFSCNRRMDHFSSCQ